MTVDQRGEQQYLGGSIDLAQLKREVIVKDMARRLEAEALPSSISREPERQLGRADWALLTEEDTWWNQQKLYRFLHRVEKDISFDRSTMPLVPPTLAGAGYVEADTDDIVYGPMMIMSSSLLSQIARRLDTCRARAAHHCFEHQVLELCTGGCRSGDKKTAPLALEHPDANASSIFIPEFALKMAARNQSDKMVRGQLFSFPCACVTGPCFARLQVVQCQEDFPPSCSAICSRRMDVYDGALYNNDHFISMCAHHVPGVKSVVARTLQPRGYAFYGDQVEQTINFVGCCCCCCCCCWCLINVAFA